MTHNIILSIDENTPNRFYSDEMRIKQVILNLISNSIKFTRKGYIKISAKLLEFSKYIEISIEDTGIGISKKDQKMLFSDFSKLDNLDSGKLNKMGSGLGLSICKKIIQNLGNRINVLSIPNKKTQFYFNLRDQYRRDKSNDDIDIYLKDHKPYENNSFDSKIFIEKSPNSKLVEFRNEILSKNSNLKYINSNIHSENSIKKNRFKKTISYKRDLTGYNNPFNSIFSQKINLDKRPIINKRIKSLIEKRSKTCKDNEEYFKREYFDDKSSYNGVKNDLLEKTLVYSLDNVNYDLDLIKIFNELNYQKCRSDRDTFIDLSTKNYNNIITSNIGAEKFIIPIIKYLKNKHKKIVLVADDNEIIRNSIKKLIKNLYKDKNIKTITLSDGIEILYLIMIDQILHNNIKIIISDEQMTFLNGTEYIKY